VAARISGDAVAAAAAAALRNDLRDILSMFLLTRDFSWCANYMPEESLVYGNLMERPIDADAPLGDACKNTRETFNMPGISVCYSGRCMRRVV
jgi:hypothetical protein